MPLASENQRHSLSLAGRLERHFTRAAKDQCWEWNGAKNDKGYGQVRVGRRVLGAHRVIYSLVNGRPLSSSEHVLHSCDNPGCVNPFHLSVGTNAENQIEAWMRDRKRNVRKLSPRDVLDIRGSMESQSVLAPRYGVSNSEISRIRTGARGKGILMMPVTQNIGG